MGGDLFAQIFGGLFRIACLRSVQDVDGFCTRCHVVVVVVVVVVVCVCVSSVV